jgi:TPR repeat protein
MLHQKNISVAQVMKLMLATNILVLSYAVPVAAGSLEDGRAAHEHRDFAIAERLFRPLAEHGNAIAQYNLGVMYYKGEGVPQSYPHAVSWYRHAAWQGDASAQLELGLMCYKGQGTLQNYAEALTWFPKAADQGSAQAQFNLGAMYANGQGVPQDYIHAHMWLSLSAAKCETRAVNLRDIVAAKMTVAQVAEAQKLAREWKPTK